MQKGSIRVNGRWWILKVREWVTVDGIRKRQDTYKKLALVQDHRANPDGSAPNSVRILADLEVAPINAGQRQGQSADSLKSYLEGYIAAGIGSKSRRPLRPVTTQSYKRDYVVVEDFIPNMQLRQVRTPDINRIFDMLIDSDSNNENLDDGKRAQSAYNNVKSFLSGAFRTAVGKGLIDFNPVTAAYSIEGRPADTYAYSLGEILSLVKAAEGQHTVQAIFVVATFTGLRLEEIRGLKWEDYVDVNELPVSGRFTRDGYNGKVLNVRRTVVHSHIEEDTKTESSRAPVPVIGIVKKYLDAHLKRNSGDGYIFHGIDSQKPINSAHLTWDAIIPSMNKAEVEWHAFHAFRRGLQTKLNDLGVSELTISHIARHSVKSLKSVAGRHYIKPSLKRMRDALEKVEVEYLALEKKGRRG
jgi:integrase